MRKIDGNKRISDSSTPIPPPHPGASYQRHQHTLHKPWMVVSNAHCESVDQAYLDNRVADLLIRQRHDTVRNLFVSIYFSHFELFLPTNTHPPNTCSHLRYDLTTCSLPFISFRFHHSHQVRTIANNQRSRFGQSTKDRSYLLARLFARHLLPSDSVSQGFANRQPRRPLLHELVMRLYITRNRVQGDSRRRRSLTTG